MTVLRLDIQTGQLPRNQTSVIRMLKGGTDTDIWEYMGLGEGAELGNFNHMPVYSLGYGFGDVGTNWTILEPTWETYLLNLQPAGHTMDDGNGNQITVTKNMQKNWLIGEGRPYWYKDGKLVLGLCLVGNQPVRIKCDANGDPIITIVPEVRWPSREGKQYVTKNVPFVEYEGFTPALKDKPLEWLLENAYVQRWTETTKKGGWRFCPRWTMNPVWDSSFPHNNNGKKLIPLMYLV